MRFHWFDEKEFIPDDISQRLPVLDLVRLVAMVMMIQGHTLFELTSPNIINTNVFPWNVWDFIRGITAPVFLIVSGAVNVFANKRDSSGRISPKTSHRRLKMALILIFIGYFVVFPVKRIYDLIFLEKQYWLGFFQVNILQLIGVSLIFLLVLFIFTRNDKSLFKWSLIIALAITFLTPVVHAFNFHTFLPEYIAAYFSYQKGTIFSIFPYTAYLFFGAAFGAYLKNVPIHKRIEFLKKNSLVIGVAFFAIGIPLALLFQEFTYLYKYNLLSVDLGLVFIRSGCVFIGMPLIAYLYEKTKNLSKYYSFFGKKAIYIYIIHLLILYGTPVFPGFASFYQKALSLPSAFGYVILIELSTIGIAYFIDYAMAKSSHAKDLFRYSLTAYLIYVLFI
ncbi:MAG: hypothetical protein HW421_1338 [Ignavibacteria bacterium]|nr:hypothetical protein [Ignavibacteria bacterium]